MEYVRVANLKEGDVLGKVLYNDKLQVMAKPGTKLTKNGIQAIKQQGYKGVYIQSDDANRRETIPLSEPLVEDTEMLTLLQMVKTTFEDKNIFTEPYCASFKQNRAILEQVCANLVSEIKRKDAEGKFLYELEDTRTNKNWLYYHSINTMIISAGIAYKIGLNDQEIANIAFAGLIHDLGKMLLSEELRNKADLTDDEKKKLREHPEKVYRLLQRLNYSVTVSYGVWLHHEKIDGSGYPNGVKLEKITLSAQIVALASAFDNLVNIQPYNDKPMLQSEALEYLQGCGLYSIDCLIALFKFIVPYPVGTKVQLSNGEQGLVLKNVSDFVMRPYVIVGSKLYDLANNMELMNITITNVIED